MRSPSGPGPLDASILVEGLRARPSFFVAGALLVHAAVWMLALWLTDWSPHPRIAIGLALGREWQIGYVDAPPLAPWLMAAAYRAGGIAAVYVLGPVSVALAGWLLFAFARRLVGDRQAALAIFVMAGVHPVAFPVGAFDADLLQMPLIALTVLAWWRAVKDSSRPAFFVLALALAALAYAGAQGLAIVAALACVTVVSRTGRSPFLRHEILIVAVAALFVFTLFLTPRLIWLAHQGFAGAVQGVEAGVERDELLDAYGLTLAIAVGHIGLLVLAALAGPWRAPDRETAPFFVRPALDRFGRWSVIALALLPAPIAVAAVYFMGSGFPVAAAAPLLIYSGLLAVVLAPTAIRIHRQRAVAVAAITLLFLPPVLEVASTFAAPWVGGQGRAANWPAAEAGRYMTEVFRTRTGKPLAYVIGDARTASLIALTSRDRPRVFLAADPARAPWIDANELKAAGALVVWPVEGPDTAPPAALAARLPGLVAEAPLSLNRPRPGRLDAVRLGWAIVLPVK